MPPPNPRISVVFDWDHTLSPIYMQGPIFQHYGIVEKDFWAESHRRTAEDSSHLGTRCFVEHVYLNYMLECAADGRMASLDNSRLTELGKTIPVFPGVQDLMERLWMNGVEVYIVTSGIRTLLLEHPAIPEVSKKNIHGSEFLDYTWENGKKVPAGHIVSIAKTILPSDKIRVLEEIAKGCGEYYYDACVPIPEDQYFIPYKNMIYVGDGVSDIYAFEHVRKNGGIAVGVYDSHKSFKQLEMIRQDGFLDVVGEANFTFDRGIGSWIWNKVCQMISEGLADTVATEEKRLANIRSHAPEFIFPWSK
jgi:phosphoglycolate phosphatase-like HAD superfamily hydrolase